MPILYARPSWRLARQLIADIAVVIWVFLCWAAAGIAVSSIKAVAGPSQFAQERLKEVSRTLSDSARKVGELPLVGETLSSPLADVSTEVTSLQGSAAEQVNAINQAATTIGWLVFILPVATVLLLWLPWRMRFVRTATSISRLQLEEHSAALLAWRALANAPLPQLQRITADPLGALRAGDQDIIEQLAALESHRHGVSYRQHSTQS